MINRSFGQWVLVASLAVTFSTSLAVATTILKHQQLPQLVEESERAALVQVIAVDYGYDENRLPSTVVTLRVEDPIYGIDLPAVGEKFRIKVFGAPEPLEDGLRFFVSGTPRYRPGERYLLLLIGRSQWGFTNTAGLPFGAFRINEDQNAVSLAGNRLALGEAGLRVWLPESVPVSSPLAASPDDAVPYSLLRRAVAELWTARGGQLRGAP